MTLSIFSLMITISKREISLEKALQNESAQKIFEENRRKVDHFVIRHY